MEKKEKLVENHGGEVESERKNQLLKVLLLLVAPGGGLLCHGYVFFRLTMSDLTLYIYPCVCASPRCVRVCVETCRKLNRKFYMLL